MINTEFLQEGTENTTTTEDVTITVPDRVVDAIAARLSAHEDPDETNARDVALDHVQTNHRLVTENGDRVEAAALERADTDTDDVELTFGEDESDLDDTGSSDEVAEPIDAEASAQLDYATDPERPLSIDVEIPAGVIGDDELDDVLETVSINARIVDE